MHQSTDPAAVPQPTPDAVLLDLADQFRARADEGMQQLRKPDTRPQVSRPAPKPRRRRKKTDKPDKPYPNFPLTAHPTGRWCKKIKGKTHYFGYWKDGWQKALDNYERDKDALLAGRTPRPVDNRLTIKGLVDRFLTHKKRRLESHEIAQRTFNEYYATGLLIADTFGRERPVDDLRADDFEALRNKLAKTNGPVRLGNEIQRVRSVFKYGFDAEHLDKPVRFGVGFKGPSKKVLRQHRAKKGKRMFQAPELRQVLNAAGVQMKAMILLGINCGFGNSDCGKLPLDAVDLVGGWINFPRPKTGVDRRCPLWPETVKAIKAALKDRPAPKNPAHAGLVFITKHGNAWAKDELPIGGEEDAPEKHDNPLSKEMAKLLRSLKIQRPGLNFYALRHTFRTAARSAGDREAIRKIMGHESGEIDEHYIEHVTDESLRDVANVVRKWLLGK